MFCGSGLVTLLILSPAMAQFEFFNQMFEGQRQQQEYRNQVDQKLNPVETAYYEAECGGYLCEDTLTCVEKPSQCPCPFESSQIKCMLPGTEEYVCISKPSNSDGPNCDYVVKAYNGEL